MVGRRQAATNAVISAESQTHQKFLATAQFDNLEVVSQK